MKSIEHKFEYLVQPLKVFNALISGDQISKWWTTSAILKPEVGEVGTFKWAKHGWTVSMRLQEAKENEYIEWVCIKSNMQNTNAWVGTTLKFAIQPKENGTILNFSQSGYEESSCQNICNDGWSFVLGKNLKSFLEIGVGYPYQS